MKTCACPVSILDCTLPVTGLALFQRSWPASSPPHVTEEDGGSRTHCYRRRRDDRMDPPTRYQLAFCRYFNHTCLSYLLFSNLPAQIIQPQLFFSTNYFTHIHACSKCWTLLQMLQGTPNAASQARQPCPQTGETSATGKSS